jgi:prevent-host-death family protein
MEVVWAPYWSADMLPKLIPVTDIKRKATEIIKSVQREQEPLLITERGREAAILMDVASYRMQERKMALLEGIIRGQQALASGKVLTHEEVLARTSKWA